MAKEKDEKEAERPAQRDIRIDRIIFVKELIDKYQKPLIDQVKEGRFDGDRVEGDYAEGLIVETESTVIDIPGFIKLWKKKVISDDQFERAISVSPTEAQKILSENDLKKISTKKPGSKVLRPTRKKGVQMELIDAVKSLSDEILSPAKLGSAA